MSAYFNQLELDMIALESAIGAYEVDNNITDEALDRADAYSYATESACSEDDFGFGIFDDVATPATEGAGSAIGGGIKKILNAIAGFFKKVAEGVKSFFASFKKKKAETADKEVKLTPEAAKVANNIRNAIKTAVGIISNVSKQDAIYIKNVIDLINTAIKNAKVDAKAINNSYLDGASDKQKNYRAQKLDSMGEEFKKISVDSNASADDKKNTSYQDSAADEMLTKCEGYLKKVEATRDQLVAAVAKVQEMFQSEVSKLNLTDPANVKFGTDKPGAAVQRGKDDDDEADIKAYNEHIKHRTGVGAEKVTGGKKDLAIKSITNQIKQYVFVNFDMSGIENACKDVVKSCESNAAMCTTIASNSPESGSGNTGVAYRMCRILSSASNIYTAIQKAIEQLTTGSIFNADVNGTKISGKVTVKDYDDASFANTSTSIKDE